MTGPIRADWIREQTNRNKQREKDLETKTERQPIAGTLPELAEPEVLKRDGERSFEAYDREQSGGDIAKVAIEAVQEDDARLALAIAEGPE
jgi:hypothetical protein